MILRNVYISSVLASKSAPKKPISGKVDINFDMTLEIAERFGWDCLYDPKGVPTNGWDTLKLNGDLAVVTAKFKPNSKKSGMAEITATSLGTFSAHRTQEKGEQGVKFHLSAILRSTDDAFESTLGPYWRGLGEGTSQLVLAEAQVTLFTKDDEDKDEE